LKGILILLLMKRMAKYPMRPLNHTCFLDIHFDPPPLKWFLLNDKH
jgi:hypothetical protein